jgi:hypothetical protein
MSLIHLQTHADKGPLNRRVDLRVRNKHGAPIYDHLNGKPVPGTLLEVKIKVMKPKGRRNAMARKYLVWTYRPDPGVDVPSAVPGYAHVLLGPTSRNYFMELLEGG